MENINNNGKETGKTAKMTLKGYYKRLPDRLAPKYDFVSLIAKRCHVTKQTVRNWILYGVRPQQHIHTEVLSEVTGISEEDLWRD